MKKTTSNLTIKEMRASVLRMRPGDVYEIPKESTGGTELVTLDKIYSNIVQFHRENGTKVTLSYFDAMNANLVKPAGFEVRSNDMELDDMADTFSNI